MNQVATVPVVNCLLETLPPFERDRFLRGCETVDLFSGDAIVGAGEPGGYVYFPLTGSISLVVLLPGHGSLEVALIGNEGMHGSTEAPGSERESMRAVVQGDGTALRMSAARFRRAIKRSPGLARTLGRYRHVLYVQLTHLAACVHFHELGPRLARRLLMAHDRAGSNRLHLTHKVLADLLGVRRSGISVAAGRLQKAGLIRYVRGTITIGDRKGLEAASCGCYDLHASAYVQRLGTGRANGAPNTTEETE